MKAEELFENSTLAELEKNVCVLEEMMKNIDPAKSYAPDVLMCISLLKTAIFSKKFLNQE